MMQFEFADITSTVYRKDTFNLGNTATVAI